MLLLTGCSEKPLTSADMSRIPIQSRISISSAESSESIPNFNDCSSDINVPTLSNKDLEITTHSNISSSLSQSGNTNTASSQEAALFTFPKVMADHMVLQRNTTVCIWGSYPKDGEITISFAGNNFKGQCKNGSFEVMVKTGPAGGPYAMTISSQTDKTTLNDILVGDVYLCSGQSNMLMQVGALKDKTLRNTPVPDKIRLLRVWTAPSKTPMDDFDHPYSTWVKTDNTNIGHYDNFSAVAYIFGKTLYEKYKIPIGIIQACEGDTIAASWIPEKDAQTVNKLNQYEDSLQRRIASRMYNGMIHPLRKYAIKGVLWYQGESDINNNSYVETMSTLIQSWRREFNNPNMTFTIIQLPRWGGSRMGEWFDIRNQQKSTALSLLNCTYSVNLDCGEMADIHPQDKETIGVRAAQATMRAFYGESSYKSSPTYQSHTVNGNKVSITFSNIDKGLVFRTEKNAGEKDWVTVTQGIGFEIKDSNGEYHKATAVLNGNMLILSSNIAQPKGIRYGYDGINNFPDISLFDKNGLPVEQFQVDFE